MEKIGTSPLLQNLLQLPADAKQINTLLLAYIGDAVLELYVRAKVLSKNPGKVNHAHLQSVLRVNAKAQARVLRELIPELSEPEMDIVRRGKNTKAGHQPRSCTPLEYSLSTAIEALLGYLYLENNQVRLDEILQKLLAEEVNYEG
ncbi:MAG: ribonuclease III domain-containing protein [Clostridia bacterium]